MDKHFIVERESEGGALESNGMSITIEPVNVEAFELFKTRRSFEMIYVGTEILYNNSKYKVTRIETIFDTNPMCEGVIQDHINIYLQEI